MQPETEPTDDRSSSSSLRRSVPSSALRLWPGVLLVAAQWGLRYGLPLIDPEQSIFAVMGGLVFGIAVAAWWLLASRAPVRERLAALAFVAIGFAGTFPLLHESIRTGGMGMMYPLLAVPPLCLAFVTWAAVSRRLPERARIPTMALTIFAACGAWALMRTLGSNAYFENDLAWRWDPTPEERLVAGHDVLHGEATEDLELPATADWPGFRGADRDGVVRGVRVATDWDATPPAKLWTRPVGPGWSSFSVAGDLVFTQEQRGEEEIVACYSLKNGDSIWRHADVARFWESIGGAGPRGTPTYVDGRLYALGATGILNVLDARDGSVVWSRDAATDASAELPMWGFSGSPLVLEDRVVVAAAGALIAYDRASGDVLWKGPNGGGGYSSPHLLELDGEPQVVLQSAAGVTAVDPGDGAVLWEHAWAGDPIVQPALTGDGDLLVSVSDRSGVRRLSVRRAGDGWTVTEGWTSIRLKPYFNDFVVRDGHAYGFDGGILACVDLANGKRVWKGGRYGRGQLVLLADQGLLLVVGEQGEVALVDATLDEFTERGRFEAIEGKTWNHPVVAGDVLIVRNAEEMAAYRLPLASD